MTPNDTQIDALVRRYAKHAKRSAATEHLDADQLNAFAERKLPAVAYARCVSHLADCDECRKIAAQLAMTAGAAIEAEPVTPELGQEPRLWRPRFASLFAHPTLRYAAFVIVLVAVAGAIFLALRRPRESALVAQNEPTNQTRVSEVKAPESGASNQSSENPANRSTTGSEAAQNSNLAKKQDESKAADNPAAPKTEKETTSSGVNPPVAGKKEEPAVAESSPSYAPPPPGEREITTREERDVRRAPESPAPRTTPFSGDKSRAAEQARTDELAKDRRTENENRPVDQIATSQNKATPRARPSKAEAVGAATTSPNKRAVTESEKQDTQNAGAGVSSETRSVGGRKFRRQGNAWVDAKFKSSMTLRNISRGSDEFASLDAGLRSIAQQLGGEVIVVWKGKAYAIR